MIQMTAYDYGYQRGVDSGDFDGYYGMAYNGVSCHAASDDEQRGYGVGYKIGYDQGCVDRKEFAA